MNITLIQRYILSIIGPNGKDFEQILKSCELSKEQIQNEIKQLIISEHIKLIKEHYQWTNSVYEVPSVSQSEMMFLIRNIYRTKNDNHTKFNHFQVKLSSEEYRTLSSMLVSIESFVMDCHHRNKNNTSSINYIIGTYSGQYGKIVNKINNDLKQTSRI